MNIKPSTYISWQMYDDAVYIMREETETFVLLKDSGYLFWKTMITLKKYELICAKLESVYNLESGAIEPELKEFISELSKLNVIEVLND